MKQRSSLLKHMVTQRTALCGLGAGLLFSTAVGVARAQESMPVKPPIGKVKTPPEPLPPPSGNPLVLSDATSNVPPPHQDVPKNAFRDYRDSQSAGPTNVRGSKVLPLFG